MTISSFQRELEEVELLSRLAEQREPLTRRLEAMIARRAELIETW
jgi:hypothetical protein